MTANRSSLAVSWPGVVFREVLYSITDKVTLCMDSRVRTRTQVDLKANQSTLAAISSSNLSQREQQH